MAHFNYKLIVFLHHPFFCGDIINGTTNHHTQSIYYTFINDLTNAGEAAVWLQFSTCDSSFDTTLYLYDSHWTEIQDCSAHEFTGLHGCRSCGDNASQYRAQLNSWDKLNESIYFLEITGYEDSIYGTFQLQIDCDFEYSFAPMPTPYPTRIALNASCAVENHQYICECTDYQCKERRIFCLDDMDCHLKCIGKSACDDAVVVWPKNGTGSIECNGPWACAGVTFPQPLSNHSNESYVIECDHEGECAFASIICPQTADCHVKCIGKSACDDAVVVWPKNGTGSIECNGPWACAGVTFPQP
eukprot:705558_1